MTATITQGMSDPAWAARLRDSIELQIQRVVDRERPNYRYGSVTSIDSVSRTAQVQFPENATSVTVSYGFMAPSKVGQQVRVAGVAGDLYIIDVYGSVVFTGIDPADLIAVALDDVIPGLGSLVPVWSAALGYPEYKIEYATDAAFTSPIEVITNQRESEVIPNLDPDTQYWVRLYAGNGQGAYGPAGAAVGPRTPLRPGVSDGDIPQSPPALVRPGLKSLYVNWSADDGTDVVLYQVHASDTSGFTPSPATLALTTPGTFAVLDQMPDGSPISTVLPTYVRLIASDVDGTDSAGVQGSATASLIELGDVGNVPNKDIHDGIAPTTSPTPIITPAPGSLFLNWTHTPNDDAVTYDVHISTVNGFTPATNTLVAQTPSNFTVIRAQSAADGGGALNYAVTYYVKIIATDPAGPAPEGAQVSATVPRVDTADIQPLAITTALIGDAQIAEAKIVDAAITNAKIALLAVDTGNIANLAVTTAKIDDLAVNTAKIALLAVTEAQIANLAVTNAKIASLAANKITAGTIGAHTIQLNGVSSIIRSSNWASGSTGWIIRGDGSAEFNDIDLFDSIDIGGSDATSFHVDSSGRMWLGAGDYASAPFRVNNNGDAVVNNLTVNGTHNITGTTQNYSGTNTVIYGGNTNVQSTNYSGTTAGWQVTSGGQGTFNGGLNVGGGDMTLTGGGRFRTDTTGARVEMGQGSLHEVSGQFGSIEFYGNASQGPTIYGGNGSTSISDPNNFFAGVTVTNSEASIWGYNGDDITVSAAGIEVNGDIITSVETDSFFRSGGKITINGTLTNPAIANTGSGTLQFQNNSITHIQLNDNTNYPQVRLGTTAFTTNPLVADSSGAGLKYIRISTSTEAIKENIAVLDGTKALRVLHQVDPIEFDSIADDGAHLWGFSAENVASASKHLASFGDDGKPSGLDNVGLISLLYASVKELAEKVRVLEGGKAPARYKKTVPAGSAKVAKRQFRKAMIGGESVMIERSAEDIAYEASLPAAYWD